MVKVFYNGQDLFENIAPTPFVGVDDEFINYGNRFGTVKNINLEGFITGQCRDFNFFVGKQNTLIGRLANDFKLLEIQENNSTVFSGNYIKINSLNFGESVYNGLVPFSLSLSSYDQKFFNDTYGVTEPKNDTQYSEERDGTVKITRSFSAKGFNTSNIDNNTLTNAINYVGSLTSVASLIAPQFITSNTSNLVPRNISETVDRLNSTYSVDMEYLYRKGASSSTLLYYNIDISYNEENGIYQASINGNLSAPIGVSISSLRSQFNSFKGSIYSLVNTKFREITNYQYLNSTPENYSATENELDNNIAFSYSYSSDPFTTKFNTNYSLSYDYPKDLYNLNINGVLTTKGPQSLREGVLENELQKINMKSLAINFYNSNVADSTPLNLNYKSFQVNRNKTSPQISIAAQFDNSPIPPNNFKSFVHNTSISPSFYVHLPIQFLNGDNGVFVMNFYKRGTISVQGTAVSQNSSDLTSSVRTEALRLLDLYASTVGALRRLRTDDKIERQIESTENGYVYTFTITDSCETTIWQ
jgi:hypothetical protein